MKHCPNCGNTKPLSEFHRDKSKASGYVSWCKACSNPQRSKRGYQGKQTSYSRAAYLAWKSRHPDGLWEQWLKKAHGMSPEQWFTMWQQQAGLCYLCDEALPENRSNVAVDHDHSHCGKKRSCGYCRRGLAHDRCNMLLGLFNDDVALMRRTFATIVANFERIQTQTQARMAIAPQQDGLFGDDEAVGL